MESMKKSRKFFGKNKKGLNLGWNFWIIQRSLTKNKYKDNITLNNIGLGCDNEDLTLYYDVQGSGLASLTKRKLDHFNIDFNESEIVKIKTLDSYCSDNKINHIHLLKIDVEGHELDVLAGANKMFLNNSIDMVTFEFGGCNIDTRTFFQEFWYFFTKNDMDIYRITPSGYLYKLEQYKEIIEQYRTTNFIAIKKIILTLNPGWVLSKIIPVILSGGSGTRLWPLSRKQYPKQYLPLASDNTMLQETILRLNGLDNLADPIIACNADHRFLVAEQCQQIDIKNPIILLEPIGRNTAPVIAAAALQSLKTTNDAVLLVLSADHVIQDVDLHKRFA